MGLSKETLNCLYRYAFSLTMDRDDAYDLLQQAVEVSLRKPPAKNRALQSYLRRIIRNRFIDEWRRSDRLTFEVFSEQDYGEQGADGLGRLDLDRDSIARLLPLLAPLQRESFYFWVVEGFSASEIARITGEPKGTILARLNRIRQQLQRRFAQDTVQRNGSLQSNEGGAQGE